MIIIVMNYDFLKDIVVCVYINWVMCVNVMKICMYNIVVCSFFIDDRFVIVE